MSVGWVGAAAAVGGALISADASRSAANSQADAAQRSSDATLQAQREANDLQKYMYDTTRSDNQPFLQNGTAASNRLSYLLGLPVSSAGANSSAAAAYKPVTASDLVDTSGAYWAPNQTLYSNSPEYRAAYDAFIADHAARYNGRNPSAAAGSDASGLQGWMASHGFDLNAYNAAQQTTDTSAQQAAQAAANADPSYGSLMRSFTKDDLQNDVPYQLGFQYALDQGQLGVNRLAAASGSLNSGATLKALQDRAANVANQYAGDAYNRFTTNQTNQYNRLAGLAGSGQTAANTLSSAGSNYANAGSSTALGTGNALSNIYTSAGNARGASAIAGGNSLNSGISSGLNFYNTNNLLSRIGSPASASPSYNGYSYMPDNAVNLGGAF